MGHQEKVLHFTHRNESKKHDHSSRACHVCILHNLCVRFSDNGEDLQDGADVNIVDDNFAIEPGRVQDDRWQQLLMLMDFL